MKVQAVSGLRARSWTTFEMISTAPADCAMQGEELSDYLPSYGRSLLRVRVPVMVSLAHQKQAVGKIVELVPGSIIQFSKPCDEMLELEVGGRRVAQGECVKVGDKFGLRITSFILPDERFETVKAPEMAAEA